MNKTTSVIIGVVLIAVSFYGGMQYGQSKTASAQPGRNGQFGAFAGRGGQGQRGGGGFVAGKILSKDVNGITIQLMGTSTAEQGSAIVLFSASTTITKTTTGTNADLITGQDVTVNGVKNSDGSITANSIQLRSSMR